MIKLFNYLLFFKNVLQKVTVELSGKRLQICLQMKKKKLKKKKKMQEKQRKILLMKQS